LRRADAVSYPHGSERIFTITKKMSRSLKKKKFFITYIPYVQSPAPLMLHFSHPTDLHLNHNLLVNGEVHVGESGLLVGETDLHVAGDLTIAGEILVDADVVAGAEDRVVNGNLIVEGKLTVGVTV
jgi:hypothetical protein